MPDNDLTAPHQGVIGRAFNDFQSGQDLTPREFAERYFNAGWLACEQNERPQGLTHDLDPRRVYTVPLKGMRNSESTITLREYINPAHGDVELHVTLYGRRITRFFTHEGHVYVELTVPGIGSWSTDLGSGR